MRIVYLSILLWSLSGLSSTVYACYEPLPDDLFDHNYHAIVLTHGDGNRLEMSRQLVRHNCVTTLQVADLMELLQGGGNRLELARAAYSSTVDPENYLLLMDLLYGHGHRQELFRFIHSQPQRREQRRRNDDWDRDDWDDWDDDRREERRWDDDDDDYQVRERGRGHSQRGRSRRGGPSPRAVYLSPFEEVMLIIQSERDATRREYVARRYVSSHRVCTEEIMILMDHLQGSRRKLLLAKHGYQFVSDPHQYRQVIAHIPGRSHQSEFRTWLHWQRG